jgi:outer membrane protein assembly factor BamC
MYSSRYANSFHRSAIAAATALAVLALSGCSVLQDDKVDYKTAKKGSALEVPPDLTQLQSDSRYQAPGASVRASEFQGSTAAAATTPTAASVAGDVRIERQGAQRWLVVKRAPQDLWDPVRDFWQDNGFLLETDNKALGIMETDWAENRAKLPQDFIRESLGKLFESLYSTGELDKFRTRMERNDKGETEIYVSPARPKSKHAGSRATPTRSWKTSFYAASCSDWVPATSKQRKPQHRLLHCLRPPWSLMRKALP